MDFVNQGISPSWSVRWRFLLFLITDSTSKDAEREIQRYKYTHTCHAYGRTHRSTQKAAPLYASIQTPTILAHTWTTQAARTCFLSLVDQDWLHYTHTSSLSHFTCTVTLIVSQILTWTFYTITGSDLGYFQIPVSFYCQAVQLKVHMYMHSHTEVRDSIDICKLKRRQRHKAQADRHIEHQPAYTQLTFLSFSSPLLFPPLTCSILFLPCLPSKKLPTSHCFSPFVPALLTPILKFGVSDTVT